MKSTNFGAFAAQLLSLGTRALGYFLFAVAFAVYRRDPRFITLFACIGVILALFAWTAFW